MFTPTVKEIAGWNRSELELAFRESQQRLIEMVERAPTPVVLQDLSFRYVLANHFVRTLYWRGRDMVGKTPFDVWPPETAERLVERLREIIESQHPVASEDILPHPDGDRTMLVHRFPLRDTNGNPSLIAVIGVDITAHTRAETHAIHTAELAQRASRAKSDLISQMRTPLDTLVGHARRLQVAQLSASAAESVDGIAAAASQLLALIDQLPEIEQIDTAGKART